MLSRRAALFLFTTIALVGALALPGAALADSPPVCTPFTQSVTPSVARTVLIFNSQVAFCSDPAGNLMTFTVDGGTKGVLDLSQLQSGKFTYTPNVGATGDDQLTLVAHDPSGASSVPVAITMRITTANQAPICTDDPNIYVIPENTTGKRLTGACYDPDQADTLQFNPLPPAHGSAAPVASGFNYAPNHNYLGPDTIHYTVTDNHGATSATSGSTQVNVATADAPTCIEGPELSQRTDKPITGNPDCSDNAGTPLSQFVFSVVQQGQHGNVIFNGDTFTYTPNAGFQGTDTFTYTATNFAGISNVVAQTVSYSATFNSAPQCTALPASEYVHENRTATVAFQCVDQQGDPISVSTTTQGSNGQLTNLAHNPTDPDGLFKATYTPNSGYTGLDTVAITPNDDQSTNSVGQAVTVSLNVISDTDEQAPVCQPGTVTVHNDNATGVIFAPSCTDQENDTISLSIGTPPAHGTLTGPDANGVFHFVPNNAYTGPDSFSLTASDGIKTSALPVSVTILPPNHPPTCTAFAIDADHSGTQTINLASHCTDPDQGDVDTVVLDSATANGALSAVSPTGTVTYTPGVNFAGGDETFTYHEVDTSNATSAVETVTIHVDQVPTCVAPPTVTVGHNTAATLSPCTDPDGDTLSYASDGDPAHGAISTSAGKLVYTPSPGYAGADSFKVHADDGRAGLSASITVNVTVGADHAPVCTPHTSSVANTASVQVPLSCTDADGDTVTLSVVLRPAHGLVSAISNGKITYTPFAGYVGSDSFTYRGTDSDPSHLAGSQVTVGLTVTGTGGGTTSKPPTGTPTTPTKAPAPGTSTTPTNTNPPQHAKTLAEIAQGILKHPVASLNVGLGGNVPAFVAAGVGSTLTTTASSTPFLVFFCNCQMTVAVQLTGHGAAAPKNHKQAKAKTTKYKLKIPAAGTVKVTLTAAQRKALTKGGTITVKVTLTTPNPKNKRKTLKTVRSWTVKAPKPVKKANKR